MRIDAHADRARCDERVEVKFLWVEEPVHRRGRLMRVVASDCAAVCHEIVRATDLRVQKELDVEQRIGREDHEVGRLLPTVGLTWPAVDFW